MVAVPLAVRAALLNAAASVLQRRGNQSLPEDRASSIRLLFDLIQPAMPSRWRPHPTSDHGCSASVPSCGTGLPP